MPTILLGVALLFLLIWGLYGFSRVDAKVLMPILKKAGGIVALAGAAFFTVLTPASSDATGAVLARSPSGSPSARTS